MQRTDAQVEEELTNHDASGVRVSTLTLAERTLSIYQAGPKDARLTVYWHHGSPNIGEPPGPLLAPAWERGIAWASHDRPGYGESTPQPLRTVASVGPDFAAGADALGLERCVLMAHSGGSPHALACAALHPERVVAAVCFSGLAPFDAAGLDWYRGMAPAGEAQLRAAREGRERMRRHVESTAFDPEMFTAEDRAALDGEWSWLGSVAQRAQAGGLDGFVDDNVAFTLPWGFDLNRIPVPVLIVHGGRDRIVPPEHAEWLAARCPVAELWLRPDDGHVSVLHHAVAALDWLLARGL